MCASLPHSRFWYRSIEQRAESSVQPPESMILHCQLHTVPCTHTHTHTRQEWVTQRRMSSSQSHMAQWPTYPSVSRRVGSLVELQLGLDVLCGEGDADLDPSCDATWVRARGGDREALHVNICWLTAELFVHVVRSGETSISISVYVKKKKKRIRWINCSDAGDTSLLDLCLK